MKACEWDYPGSHEVTPGHTKLHQVTWAISGHVKLPSSHKATEGYLRQNEKSVQETLFISCCSRVKSTYHPGFLLEFPLASFVSVPMKQQRYGLAVEESFTPTDYETPVTNKFTPTVQLANAITPAQLMRPRTCRNASCTVDNFA